MPLFVKKNKLLNAAVKLLVTALLSWALYRQVFAKEELPEIWKSLQLHFYAPNFWWLVLVLVLAPVNLAFETLKWQELIKNFSRIRFWKTYKAVIAGTTIGIFTPNRVGEYGGRVLFVEPEHGWKAVIATMVGSIGQSMVILSAGLLGAAWFSWQLLSPEPYLLGGAVFMGVAALVLLFFLFYNIDLAIPIAKRIPHIQKFKKYLKHLAVLSNYTSKELSGALWFSMLRYLTFCSQYYFLLLFFDIPAPWLLGMAGIAAIFLVQASIPLPPAMGLLARGEIALFVWGFFSEDKVAILAATFTLFVINVVTPALLGLVFIVQTNIAKSFGYENSNDK